MKSRRAWTAEADRELLRLREKYGNQWKAISAELNRPSTQVTILTSLRLSPIILAVLSALEDCKCCGGAPRLDGGAETGAPGSGSSAGSEVDDDC